MFSRIQPAIRRLHHYRQQVSYAVLGILTLLLVLQVILTNHFWNRIPVMSVPNVTMECLGILVLLIIFHSIIRSKLNNLMDTLFLTEIALEVLFLFSDAIFWMIDGIPSLWYVNLMINVIQKNGNSYYADMSLIRLNDTNRDTKLYLEEYGWA